MNNINRVDVPFYVNRTGDSINIISAYGKDTSIGVELCKTGNNNIFNFAGIYILPQDAAMQGNISTGKLIENICSDWIGPHRVFAVENIDGDMPLSVNFTGGNHAYDGAHCGTATGRTAEIGLYIDGRAHKNFSGYCNRAEIKWVNYIQASNTKKSDGTGREVIRESFHLNFTGKKYEIVGEIEFLEDALWQTYFGLQCTNGAWRDYVSYQTPGGILRHDAKVSSGSGERECCFITLEKANDRLDMQLDKTYGIGDRSFLLQGDAAFTAGYGKTYFNLVNSAGMKKGDKVGFKGYYKFYCAV